MMMQAILAVLLSVALGELIKTATGLLRGEGLRFGQLGGMPSTHAAAVSSLVLAVYIEEGRITPLVLACVVFGWIVLRDAYGVRWEVTKHSTALNKILKTREYARAGHTLLQVIAGVALGAVVTAIVYIV